MASLQYAHPSWNECRSAGDGVALEHEAEAYGGVALIRGGGGTVGGVELVRAEGGVADKWEFSE